MWEEVRARLAGPAGERLRAAVRAALAEPSASLVEWEGVPAQPGGDRAVCLLAGTARVGPGERPWRLALKVLGAAASPDDPASIFFGRREGLLYRSGILDALPGGLRAPRCFGCDEGEDGSAWLWLEHVHEEGERRWPRSRWALAARHLGQFNGAYLAGRPLPDSPWLGGGRLRRWLESHEGKVARIAAAADDPTVRRYWPRPVVDALLRLWQEREVFLGVLERLPQTLCHGDAIRRNLLGRLREDGSEETVAIDWEYAGRMAAGEETGQTLSVASAFFDVGPEELPELDEALFAGYLAGLRDAGWRGDERAVRFAHAAHGALRNAFNAVGTAQPDEVGQEATRQRWGRSWEDLAEARAQARPFLLARAGEARRLLADL